MKPPKHRRPNAEYRWTRAKAVAFLRALARTRNVAAAARAVGMSGQSAYRLRSDDGEFAQLWQQAMRLRGGRQANLEGEAGHKLTDSHKLTLFPLDSVTPGPCLGARGQAHLRHFGNMSRQIAP